MAPDDASIRPVVNCDMGGVSVPDLGTVDALCRLRTSVVHLGFVLRLTETTRQLEELLALCGLDESFAVGQRQSEEGEQTLGVQEEVEPGDPPV